MSFALSDFQNQVVDLLPTQFKESTLLIDYIKVFAKKLEEIESVLKDVIEKRYIDNAGTDQLDKIGALVGQPRGINTVIDTSIFKYLFYEETGNPNPESYPYGDLNNPNIGGRYGELGEEIGGFRVLNNEEYRLFIRARIAKNTTDCTRESVIESLSFIVQAPVIITEFNLSYTIQFGKYLTGTEKGIIKALDILPRPMGVGATYASEYDAGDFIAYGAIPGNKGYGDLHNPTAGGKYGSLI